MPAPSSEIKNRLTLLRQSLKRQKLSAMIVTRDTDVRYFSGYEGEDALLLITGSDQYIFTDGRFVEECAKSAPLFTLHEWHKRNTTLGLLATLGKTIKTKCIKRVGVCESHFTLAQHRDLKRGSGAITLVDCSTIPPQLRAVKSPWEVRKTQAALSVAESSFKALRKQLKPGMTESDVRLELEYQMRKRGAEDAAFESIIAADANASLCHAHAGKRKTKRGGLLLIDFGALLDGYRSDLTRTLFFGEPSDFWKTQYKAVLEAHDVGIASLQAGEPCANSQLKAIDVLERYGVAEYYCHSLGHGIGLNLHEAPSLGQTVKAPLPANSIVTVEPGVYYPNKGGIRIESMVKVTKRGAKIMSTLPTKLSANVI